MNGIGTTAALIIEGIRAISEAIDRKDLVAAKNQLARTERMAQAWKAVVDHYKNVADKAKKAEIERIVEVEELRQRVADLERLVEILQGGPMS